MIRHTDDHDWLLISEYPPPDLDRVMICGWQERMGSVRGYWWYEEAVFDDKGVRIDCEGGSKPLYWCPIILPKFPPAPACLRSE